MSAKKAAEDEFDIDIKIGSRKKDSDMLKGADESEYCKTMTLCSNSCTECCSDTCSTCCTDQCKD